MQGLPTSLCANLIAEACNIGLEPLTRNDVPALRRARLSWVNQNFIRNETLVEANACLVAEQNKIPLVRQWGGGELPNCSTPLPPETCRIRHRNSELGYLACNF